MIQLKRKTSFETEVCSRCQGSGTYSYCEEYGYTCFKCAGSGYVLSDRGAAAKEFYRNLCTVKLSEVKVGDLVSMTHLTAKLRQFPYIATVVEIERSTSEVTCSTGGVVERYYPLMIRTDHPMYGRSGISAKDDCSIRVFRDDDRERLKKALEYQDSLTKAGKIRKSKGKV